MIVKLDDDSTSELIGNKAKSLQLMNQKGFNIPKGFVLDKDIFIEIIKSNDLEEKIKNLIESIKEDNIKKISLGLQKEINCLVIPENIIEEISNYLNSNTKYAVRSSGIKEDLDSFSFAGQYDTFLNVKGIEEILKAIINCYKSMYSEGILSYCFDNNISFDNYTMAIIVQEMINSEKSGVAFTINPLTGEDKEFLIEIAKRTRRKLSKWKSSTRNI